MYFITIKRMLEVCFSAHPNIQYRAKTSLPHLEGHQNLWEMIGGCLLSFLEYR